MTFEEQLSNEVSKAIKLIAAGECIEVNSCFDIHLLNPLYNLISQITGEPDTNILSQAISAISSLSHARYSFHEAKGGNMFYTRYFDLMSDYEKTELHRLKMLLPCSGQVIAEAKARVRERLLARKAKYASKEFPNDRMIDVLKPDGSTIKVLESTHRLKVHEWTDVDVRIQQQFRTERVLKPIDKSNSNILDRNLSFDF